jgi:hypothetical protein
MLPTKFLIVNNELSRELLDSGQITDFPDSCLPFYSPLKKN